jgi:hypothetical protein
MGLLLLAMIALGCGPTPVCDWGTEEATCLPGCVPLCADAWLAEQCDETGCVWVDGTSTGPTPVYCEVVEDGPNRMGCIDALQSPRCACEGM